MKLLIFCALFSCISCTVVQQQYNRLPLGTLPEIYQNVVEVLTRIRAVLRIFADMLCAFCKNYRLITQRKRCTAKYCTGSTTRLRIDTTNITNQVQDLVKYITKSETPDTDTEIKALETVMCTLCLEQKGANNEKDCEKQSYCTIIDINTIPNPLNITTATTSTTTTSTITTVKLTNSTISPRKQTVRGHRGGSSRNGRRQQNRATSRRKQVDKRQCSSCDQLKERRLQRSCREKFC